jgi:hypothetical protein
MVEIPVSIPESLSDNSRTSVEAAVAAASAASSLRIATAGSLKQFPGCSHWHLKRAGATGTLEVTWWPSRGRMWVSYHSNRVGDGWVVGAAVELANDIGRRLQVPTGA